MLIARRLITALPAFCCFLGQAGSWVPSRESAAGIGAGISQPGAVLGDFIPLPPLGLFFFFHLHQCNEGFLVSPSPPDGARELGHCPLGSPQPPRCVGHPWGSLLPSEAMGPLLSSPGAPPALCEPGEGGEGDKGAHSGLWCPPWGTAPLPGCPHTGGCPPLWRWCPLLCWVGQSWGREGSLAAGHKPGGNAAEGQIFLKARELSASCAACKEEKLRGVLGGFLQNWGLPETGGGLGRGQPPAAGLRGRG